MKQVIIRLTATPPPFMTADLASHVRTSSVFLNLSMTDSAKSYSIFSSHAFITELVEKVAFTRRQVAMPFLSTAEADVSPAFWAGKLH